LHLPFTTVAHTVRRSASGQSFCGGASFIRPLIEADRYHVGVKRVIRRGDALETIERHARFDDRQRWQSAFRAAPPRRRAVNEWRSSPQTGTLFEFSTQPRKWRRDTLMLCETSSLSTLVSGTRAT
jgi:hypothetical protein